MFHCTKCDYATKKQADVTVTEIDYAHSTFTYGDSQWSVPYMNPFYIYNFAMCIAICKRIGLNEREIKNGFASFTNPASHKSIIHYKGKEIYYLRGKQENPEALQSQLDIIAEDMREKAVFVGMYRITDFKPFYSGSFYLFDCDFTKVVNSNVKHYVAFSQSVAGDIASRMILAGADPDNVTVVDSNDTAEIFIPLEYMDTKVVYILTNTVHAPEIKQYFAQGGASNG